MSLLSDEKIWEAILDATNDGLKTAIKKKAEKLRKIVKLLCNVSESER